ncbi:MAG: hypothetical protein KDJ36_04300 [Hyphomicrobiaceae bacterium]|nr:hypothetical protein [Hyphomicrobiaceae bacterium]
MRHAALRYEALATTAKAGDQQRTCTLLGLGAVAIMAGASIIDLAGPEATSGPVAMAGPQSGTSRAAATPSGSRVTPASPEWTFGGYGGITHTRPSTVTIAGDGKTDLKVKDFNWIGRPFKAPIYYGLRTQRWSQFVPLGGMVDFTHAKAIAKSSDQASFSGTIDGKPAAPKAKIGDMFRHLEFSHGHNMVTLNGLARLAPWWARLRPYVGVGAGVSLPHTEIGFRKKKERTYEYQFAGFVGQALAGIEIQLGRASVFVEYKFTYAPYDVPLSHEPYGWLLVTDLWRQASAWWRGEKPPGGRLQTTLISHHGIAGVLIKNRSYMDAVTH